MPAVSARAQTDCPTTPRGPIEVSPSSGAPNASPNAPVVVRYSAGYFGPDGPGEPPTTLFSLVSCGRCGVTCTVDSGGTPVSGLVQTQGDSLLFLPDGGLTGGTQYAGRATGIDHQITFTFCAGRTNDTAPPEAVTLETPTSTQVGPQPCLPDGGFRIAAVFAPVSDDGPPGSIEYLLFQTRGVDVDAPVLVDRVRNFQTDRITMSFLLSNDAARQPICLQVVSVDGAGHSAVRAGERCFDPRPQVTFQGCGVALGRPAHAALAGLVIAALALVARRRR